ncbi:MAG: endonuclease domain-containing protein, partial [Cyclobacteriaceae bacterium]
SKPSDDKVHNKIELKTQRKLLRNNGTSAEATLWLLLKGKQLEGRKFRRQHSVGNYVLDFYCPSENLAVELDGEPHFTDEGIKRDEIRAKYILGLQIRIIRFENNEVFDNPQAVLLEIRKHFR